MAEVIYSIALRCIGQDLVQRRLKTFDIKPEGSHFTALCGYQEPPAGTTEIIRYTPADIEFLDRSGESQRGKEMALMRAIGAGRTALAVLDLVLMTRTAYLSAPRPLAHRVAARPAGHR